MTVPAGHKPVWLQSANVLIDESSGAILVDALSLASTARASSGMAALATTSDAPLTAIAASEMAVYHHVRIVNEGSVAGFYSLDGGTTWCRLPAGPCAVKDDGVKIVNQAIQIKRVAGGSNLSGVYASAW